MRHTSIPAAPDAGVARLAVSFKTRAANGGRLAGIVIATCRGEALRDITSRERG